MARAPKTPNRPRRPTRSGYSTARRELCWRSAYLRRPYNTYRLSRLRCPWCRIGRFYESITFKDNSHAGEWRRVVRPPALASISTQAQG